MSEWKSFSCVLLFVTPWTETTPPNSTPLSMEFSRQEQWNGLPFPSLRGSFWPGDQNQVSHIAGEFFTIWAPREAPCSLWSSIKPAYWVGLKLSPFIWSFLIQMGNSSCSHCPARRGYNKCPGQIYLISWFLFCSHLIYLVWPWTQSTAQHVWIWSSLKSSKNAHAKTQLPVRARRKYIGE